jgi:hypothetical protein
MSENDTGEIDRVSETPRTIDQYNKGSGSKINSRSLPKEEYLNWLCYYDEGEKFTLETFQGYISNLKSEDDLDHGWVSVKVRPSLVERLRLYVEYERVTLEQAVEKAISLLRP